jgi:hypothetical protein
MPARRRAPEKPKAATTCRTRCLHLLLHFLRFFLHLLTTAFNVLASTLDRIACAQRYRGKCREAKYDFLEHENSLNLLNWGDSIHPAVPEQTACQYRQYDVPR